MDSYHRCFYLFFILFVSENKTVLICSTFTDEINSIFLLLFIIFTSSDTISLFLVFVFHYFVMTHVYLFTCYWNVTWIIRYLIFSIIVSTICDNRCRSVSDKIIYVQIQIACFRSTCSSIHACQFNGLFLDYLV